jgi:hypothetical protein
MKRVYTLRIEGEKGFVHVPTGTAIEMSVPTIARPRAGIVTSCALYKSCPAAYADPLVGAFAWGLSSWTCSCISTAAAAAIDGAIGAGGCRAPAVADAEEPIGWVGWCSVAEDMLARGVGVAVPESVPRGRVEV